jgi:hypothetical protein
LPLQFTASQMKGAAFLKVILLSFPLVLTLLIIYSTGKNDLVHWSAQIPSDDGICLQENFLPFLLSDCILNDGTEILIAEELILPSPFSPLSVL